MSKVTNVVNKINEQAYEQIWEQTWIWIWIWIWTRMQGLTWLRIRDQLGAHTGVLMRKQIGQWIRKRMVAWIGEQEGMQIRKWTWTGELIRERIEKRIEEQINE